MKSNTILKIAILLATISAVSINQNITVSNTIIQESIADVHWCGGDIYDMTDIVDET